MGLFSSVFRRAGARDRDVDPAPPEVLVDLSPLLDWFQQHTRPGWRPVISDYNSSDAIGQFGGAPSLLPGESMPKCALCRRDLQLIVQLSLGHVPAELSGRFGDGLLQLFYCIGGDDESPDHPDCSGVDGWEAFADTASLVRVLPASEELVGGTTRDDFPAQRVMGWERFEDFPGLDECEALGLVIKGVPTPGGVRGLPFTWRATWTVDGGEHAVVMSEGQFFSLPSPAAGDKLAGYPMWVQSPEYPDCPRCGTEMRLVLQIDSDDNVPYTWGDVGCGHITQCPTHLDVVAFTCACT